MNINRQYQKELLSFLLEDYPEYKNTREYCYRLQQEDRDKYLSNVLYLQNHELIEKGVKLNTTETSRGLFYALTDYPRITHKGVDFMLADGGLSAILNVQTVKLHDDTIRALLESAVKNSSLSDQDKQSIPEFLKELSAESLKHLLTKLLDKGVENLPAIIQQIPIL